MGLHALVLYMNADVGILHVVSLLVFLSNEQMFSISVHRFHNCTYLQLASFLHP